MCDTHTADNGENDTTGELEESFRRPDVAREVKKRRLTWARVTRGEKSPLHSRSRRILPVRGHWEAHDRVGKTV